VDRDTDLKLLGFSISDSLEMETFRHFQMGLPIPNCAVYLSREDAPGHWSVRADEKIMPQIQTI
jgi:hypothetical protein